PHVPSISILCTLPRPPASTLFPYTTLFRSRIPYVEHGTMAAPSEKLAESLEALKALQGRSIVAIRSSDLTRTHRERLLKAGFLQDRKSTRLNSSHVKISYAVFCLKKKNDYI